MYTWLFWIILRRKLVCLNPSHFLYYNACNYPFLSHTWHLKWYLQAAEQLAMEALPDPSCLSPSANSCQLRVNTLHKSHNWRLVIAETSGSSFLPALFLKMSCVIIPSITVGLLLSLNHMPLQTATKDVLSGQAARPPRHFPSQAVRSSSSLPEPWHLPLNKSFSFVWRRPLSLLFTLFWLSKHLKKTHPIIRGSILVSF